jgi:uncharacterized protein YbjT (DUF2867 family)
MKDSIISVVGGTGAQGGGVVDALLAAGQFKVRVALVERGVEVVQADLRDAATLTALYRDAHGAFVVTNPWDPGQGEREEEIGTAAVKAARVAGVKHLIWSTLPDVDKLSGGRLKVNHFTRKARVDGVVEAAGFERHTFVQAPFYFQNLQGMLAPQPLPGGGRGWAVPMDPAARVIHAGDVTELGRTVAAAFAAGPELADGAYLAVCGGKYSWDDFVKTLNGLGHDLQVARIPPDIFDAFFPGAAEVREMFQYFEAHTYFGPNAQGRIETANGLVAGGFTAFPEWAAKNMRPAV